MSSKGGCGERSRLLSVMTQDHRLPFCGTRSRLKVCGMLAVKQGLTSQGS